MTVSKSLVGRCLTGLRQIYVNPVTWFWIGLLFAYAALYRRLAIARPDVFMWWFNSDTLYPVHLLVDWMRDGYPPSGWMFSVAPCWFPDVILDAIFLPLTHNIVLTNLLAG